ncbi:MAG: AAA family ATPase [Candidatus Omnitrophica bacterium]|nr:AAA family ATPase [Candidatus Omnitrophota bacterium]
MNKRKLKIFLNLHWIKLLVVFLLAIITASLTVFIIIGLKEWGAIDAITKQRTFGGFPFQLYMMVIAGIFQAFIFGLMWIYIIRGGMARSFTKTGKIAVKGKEIGVRWSDVIGMEEAKKEAMEVVSLIRDRVDIEKKGAQIFRGVLLFGPPGCGKTYLVKALATETNLPFLAVSGSEFTEIFVGVGASRVRKLFKQARQLAELEGGCIIFIDEIDALGFVRAADTGFGGQTERNTTLNQLLVEMDGLRGKDDNIVVFGATNMSEAVLDPAFLRPGRFDRKIVIDLPDLEDRRKMLAYYLSKVSYDKESADLEKLARITVNFSPAEIANLVKEAIIISHRGKKLTIDMRDIKAARERILLGLKKKFKMTPEDKARSAIYEAGRVLVTYLLVPTKDVFNASIIPQGRELVSSILLTEKEEVLNRDRDLLLAEIRIALAGYVSEKIKFGSTSDTAENHLHRATALAHNMVWKWGMGKSGHVGNFEGRYASGLVAEDLDRDVEETMDLCTEELNNLLRENWQIAEKIAGELVVKDELDYDQIEAIFKEFGKERPAKEVVSIKERQMIKTGITWDDVIGMDETKLEVREVVELIKDRAMLKRVGGKIIKGLMMFGPPGCGKTYIASAMATEFKLPFLYKSGSEFEQMYVGVGAMRVRRMFTEARELSQVHGGCIIFIDEIDAIGGKRAGGEGPDVETAGVRNQTINQLLTEMDGLKGKDAQYNILVVGATNMPEKYFDPALMRPGRFDRKFHVYSPNLEDRQKLFEYYLSKVQYDNNSIRMDKMARITGGYSPADISNIVQEAAIICVRGKRESIIMQDMSEAMERIRLGLRMRIKRTKEEEKIVAYHECGHAIISYLCKPKGDTFKVSIIPRERSLGVSWTGREESGEYSENEALAYIMSGLAGFAAEKIKIGYHGAGVTSDFETALRIAHDMVYQWGMGKSGFIGNFSALFLTRQSTEPMLSEEMMARLDNDVQEILTSCLHKTEDILKSNMGLLDKMATELMEKQELDFDQMEEIFKGFGKSRASCVLK